MHRRYLALPRYTERDVQTGVEYEGLKPPRRPYTGTRVDKLTTHYESLRDAKCSTTTNYRTISNFCQDRD